MNPWDRREGEGVVAYRRFRHFLRQGRGRTVEAVWKHFQPGKSKLRLMPYGWLRHSEKFEWRERANAWDKRSPEAKELRLLAREERFARRLMEIDHILNDGFVAMNNADLAEAKREEARKLLPVLRPLIRDLVKMEADLEARLDALFGDDTGFDINTFNAIRELLREEQAKEREREALEARKKSLLLCLGPDPALYIDLAMARGVRSKTKLPLHTIRDCTSEALETHLRRERDHRRPVRWLHLACHGGADGIVLADGLVDGAWLSTYLQGVEVLLLAACKGHIVGEWLAVVPYVITFADDVAHGDAAVFMKHFWLHIAEGKTPDDALEEALEHSPEHIAEFLVKHW